MEDSELTRKAIEELMKEMDTCKQTETLPTERKKNPLGRPNKIFLGRTINSMLTYNKRQSDLRLQKREHRLKELDAKQRNREPKKRQRYRHENSESPPEVISSDSYNDVHTRKISKKSKKKKKRKKRQRSSSSSSSSISSSTASSSDRNVSLRNKYLNRKNKKYKKVSKDEEHGQEMYTDYVDDISMGYCVDPNMAYAVMAYSQMNQMIQQQQIVQQQIVKKELEESVEIPSDLSISCHSSPGSSINISLNSSSAEEDENGILTFKLSSDDEEKVSNVSTKIEKNEIFPFVSEELDKNSICSHISLGSEDSQKADVKESNEIYLLSSSCSDSEDVEIVEIIPESVNNLSQTDENIKDKLHPDEEKI